MTWTTSGERIMEIFLAAIVIVSVLVLAVMNRLEVGIVGLILCRTGFHSGDYWVYLKPDRCDQVGFCSRCNASVSQTAHRRQGVWKNESPDNCLHTERCLHCHQKIDERMEHDWGRDNCARCGKEEDDWGYGG